MNLSTKCVVRKWPICKTWPIYPPAFAMAEKFCSNPWGTALLEAMGQNIEDSWTKQKDRSSVSIPIRCCRRRLRLVLCDTALRNCRLQAAKTLEAWIDTLTAYWRSSLIFLLVSFWCCKTTLSPSLLLTALGFDSQTSQFGFLVNYSMYMEED